MRTSQTAACTVVSIAFALKASFKPAVWMGPRKKPLERGRPDFGSGTRLPFNDTRRGQRKAIYAGFVKPAVRHAPRLSIRMSRRNDPDFERSGPDPPHRPRTMY